MEVQESVGNLTVCAHQVGGHMTKDNKPDTLIDDAGRFYKPYQADARNEREASFYKMMWGEQGYGNPAAAHEGATPSTAGWGHGPLYGPRPGPVLPEDAEGLRAFIPKFYGVREVAGRQYILMEDVCHVYKQPCVLDAKIGYTTAYAWADDKYKEKCKGKDESTTQSTMGFRISGLQVYHVKESRMEKVDRQWGKTLTAQTAHAAFEKFGSNGALTPQQVFASPQGVLPQLAALRDWFAGQKSFCFYQASVLLTYEGCAQRLEEANIQMHLIDFAHTFPTSGQPDENFLAGLDSLINLLKRYEDKQ